jgi:tetratricopeptide (TPR) repeat protein
MRFPPTSAARTAIAMALAFSVIAEPLAPTRDASAQVAPPARRARELFKKSEESYREGRFQEVVDLLMEAYRLDPKPVLLYNIARAYEGLGDAQHAIEAYRHYLETDPEANDRLALEERVRTLERQEKERQALERQRDEAASRQRDKPPAAPRETTSPTSASPFPWVVTGVGAAGVGVGIALGVVARGRHDDALAEPDAVPATERQADAEHLATAATVALIAGGAIAAGGLLWGVIDLAGQKPSTATATAPRVAIAMGLGTLVFRGGF